MVNPWRALPLSAPFVLPEDLAPLRRARTTADTAFRFELLPEPFVGRPDAPVLLLGLNPGYSPADAHAHHDAAFSARLRGNLLHEAHEHPFYLLDPALAAPGREWWERRLRQLIAATDRRRVTSGICCVEFFPYHSRRYGAGTPTVPSQSYSFHLVRRAIQRGAVVVLLRSRALWLAAVPELAHYPNLFGLRSVQNVSLTPRNCPTGFAAVVARL